MYLQVVKQTSALGGLLCVAAHLGLSRDGFHCQISEPGTRLLLGTDLFITTTCASSVVQISSKGKYGCRGSSVKNHMRGKRSRWELLIEVFEKISISPSSEDLEFREYRFFRRSWQQRVQNHGVAWVGRDLQVHLIPITLLWAGTIFTRPGYSEFHLSWPRALEGLRHPKLVEMWEWFGPIF